MKRDMDLVRAVLLAVEAEADPFEIAGHSHKQILGHVRMVTEAGLLLDETPLRLAWTGHDFLAAARNESVWRGVKRKLTEKVADAPFSVLVELLKCAVTDLLI